ncbi:2-trimethylaminoethylphosphonate dioxygenase [Aestuariivirga litoralis]|uniref:2-trimethylaminoethylphosphonate dioxygenase n=1 Tax=Aestuariivirga litoralis TaxID=2650924 RepID=UPI0018C5E0A8|nr:gamma-butyrobetaine dioxygenase [Aestuariivirga litoralis]MBG1230888.1 gamma-butyrobetaine dioxygenase [Aestuariivirga litoralis]
MLSKARVNAAGSELELHWADGAQARFHAMWLRDNALDDKTRSAGNGQRLVTILDIPAATKISAAEIVGGTLRVTFTPENKSVTFPADWLHNHRYDRKPSDAIAWTSPAITRWTGADMQANVPRARLSDMQQNRDTLAHWLGAVERYGFAVVEGVPTTSGALCDIVKTFGYVRETNYGRWFEVKAEVNPSNLAYTNLGLQAHTDNPYRDPVPTLQILSCLENTVDGGESTVVDAFAVVAALQAENPKAVELLSGFPARYEYAGSNGVRLRAKRPMIELGPDGELLAIRFNNRSAAPTEDVPFEAMASWYEAYRRLAELIEDKRFEVSFKLAPGEAFIVDNTRILHARTAFSGHGSRWLQGCYADKDGLLSTLASLVETQSPKAAE